MADKYILCVDDEPLVLKGLQAQLSKLAQGRYLLEMAESGEEALEIVEEFAQEGHQLALVITDQIMPGIRGDELLARIHELAPKALKVMLTGQADALAVGQAVNRANLYRFISKPWNRDDLLLTVRQALLSFEQDRKLEEQNEQLKRYNEELERTVAERTRELALKNSILERVNGDLTASIQYAQKIQSVILPFPEVFARFFRQHFLFFRPKDIVSGDFYWCHAGPKAFYLAAADATGHGVPGAFMSLLAYTFLNETMAESEDPGPAQVLESLRAKIKASLRQDVLDSGPKDGLDISLCRISNDRVRLDYAGAHNPLLLARRAALPAPEAGREQGRSAEFALYELPADRQPVSVFLFEKPFSQQSIRLFPDDRLYLLTDGFQDQFGGPRGKKFKVKALKELLLRGARLDMDEQLQTLAQAFQNWQTSHGQPYEQVDDTLVVGVLL